MFRCKSREIERSRPPRFLRNQAKRAFERRPPRSKDPYTTLEKLGVVYTLIDEDDPPSYEDTAKELRLNIWDLFIWVSGRKRMEEVYIENHNDVVRARCGFCFCG